MEKVDFSGHSFQIILGLCILSLQTAYTERLCFVVTIYSLKTADCDRRNLKTVPANLDGGINVLKFNENQLTYLGIDQFKEYKLLQEIYLVRNRIEIIAPDAFRDLQNLQILNLEGNLLSDVPSQIFRHLRSVRILNFKSNQIRFITNTAFKNLQNIEELNFENCWLERIEPYAFKGLNKLDEINLVNNELQTLSSEMRTALPESLTVFRLHRNPWMCDCKVRWLRQWLASENINWQFAQNIPACAGPQLIKTINWKDLSPEQFACASRIVANSSTSIELPLGGNITIECVVFGDPEPTVSWKKGNKFLSKAIIKEKVLISSEGEKQLRSALSLEDVSSADAADYKCIANNSAGRSEVTYKLWVEGEEKLPTIIKIFDLPKVAIIGIVVSGIFLVPCIACTLYLAVYLYRRQNHKKQMYKEGHYKRTASKGPVKNSNQCEMELTASEEAAMKDKEQAVVASAMAAAHAEQQEAKEQALADQERTALDVDHTNSYNKINPSKKRPSTEFKMKIFSSYKDADTDHLTHIDHADITKSSEDALESGDKIPSPEGHQIREATPDLLCDEKHSRSNHKTPTPPPPPAAYYANHIAAAQRKAEENPYAKPSELRSGKLRTPEPKDTALDYILSLEKHANNTDAVPERNVTCVHSPKLTKEPLLDGTHQREATDPVCFGSPVGSKDTSACTNPVCMKTHSRSKSHVDSPPCSTTPSHKAHISSSQSVGSMSDLERETSARKVDKAYKEPPVDDRHKTLPCRTSATSGQSSPSRKLPLTPVQSHSTKAPGSTTTERSAASRPRVQFAAEVKDSPPSSLSSTPTSPHVQSAAHKVPSAIGGATQWGTTGRLANPLHPRGLKVMSPEGPRTLTFPGAIDALTVPSPVNQAPTKPSRTYGCSTSIDDLLSPPFGYSSPGGEAPSKSALVRRSGTQPRPGHKDEYGTAV